MQVRSYFVYFEAALCDKDSFLLEATVNVTCVTSDQWNHPLVSDMRVGEINYIVSRLIAHLSWDYHLQLKHPSFYFIYSRDIIHMKILCIIQVE